MRRGEHRVAQDRFYYWKGYHDALVSLGSYELAGRFVIGMGQYVFEGVEPDFSDCPMLKFAWIAIRDAIKESVEIGRKQSEYGKRGGRPKKDEKRVPKSPPKRVPKRGPERVPESVGYGNVEYPTAHGGLREDSARRAWPERRADWTEELKEQWREWCRIEQPDTWQAVQDGMIPQPWVMQP